METLKTTLQLTNKLFFSLLLSAVLLACEKDNTVPPETKSEDLPEKPELSMLKVTPTIKSLEVCGEQDLHSIALSSKDTLSLTFSLKALHGMSQYKIDIHSNFDCHAHGRTAKTSGTPWKVLDVVDIEGQDIIITKKLPVPENVQVGNYHFMLQTLDRKGNETEWVLYSLLIQNSTDTQSPEITFVNPSIDSVSISNTENVTIQMNITDNEDLYGGRVDVTYFNASGTEFTAEQYYFPENVGLEVGHDFSYAFPSTPAAGTYTFIFKAYDAVGNEAERRLNVHIEK